MFGIPSLTTWSVVFTKEKVVYYLAESDEVVLRVVWTKRKERARKFISNSDATKFAETIRQTRTDKKITISIEQA